jgi:hypothetical protein
MRLPLLRRASLIGLVSLALAQAACGDARVKYPTAQDGLALERVVLYRNGIGYFERVGEVDGDLLVIKVRKDQVNDLLKSLTVVERSGGRALSVSMPLDPQSWANAALATLAPGRGSLAEVLDVLRGTRVELNTTEGKLSGRIVMVERIEEEPDPTLPAPGVGRDIAPASLGVDHKITLLEEDVLSVVRLSKVKDIRLEDGDLAMQFNRSLDATAGEGMFQQVEVAIRLAERASHDLLLSYVVSAPMWKPTYRVVLPKGGKGQALLQGWAVVDNVSGEDWRNVKMALTSGAPIAFRYDLHTPREVERTDLTEEGVRRRATAVVGETTFQQQAPSGTAEAAAGEPVEAEAPLSEAEDTGDLGGFGRGAARSDKQSAPAPAAPPPPPQAKPATRAPADDAPPAQSIDFESLKRSTQATARAAQVSGLTRFDLGERVTVPDGSSTMVAIVNATVEGEETFLFRPGGAGVGFEQNPYRVVRFKNTTPFVLEPGPISIYAGGSFVGEGLSEAVGTNTSATIPFAVEPDILVSSTAKRDGDELRLVRILRGVLEVESFARSVTTWRVKTRARKNGTTVLIRHPKSGWNYELTQRPPETEDLPGAYLIPVTVAAGQSEGEIVVEERTPSQMSISIWDGRAIALLEDLLVSTNLTPDARAKLEPVVKLRQAIGKIDTKLDGLKRQQRELDERAEQTRENLAAIEKDNAAGALRARLTKRLEEFTSEADKIGREVVELSSERLERKIDLEDLLENLDLSAPSAPAPKPDAPTP